MCAQQLLGQIAFIISQEFAEVNFIRLNKYMLTRERGHIPIRTHPLTTFITISPLTINTTLIKLKFLEKKGTYWTMTP